MASGIAKTPHQLREDVFFYLYDEQMKWIEVGAIKVAHRYEAAIAWLILHWGVNKISHRHRKLGFKEETA